MVEKFKFILLEILLLWHCVSKSFLLGILTSLRCIYFCKHITIFIYLNKWYPWKGNSPSNNAVLVDCHCILPFVNVVDRCIYWSQRGEIDFENFLNCLSFTILISIFWSKQRKRKKKYVVMYHIISEWEKLFSFIMILLPDECGHF